MRTSLIEEEKKKVLDSFLISIFGAQPALAYLNPEEPETEKPVSLKLSNKADLQKLK